MAAARSHHRSETNLDLQAQALAPERPPGQDITGLASYAGQLAAQRHGGVHIFEFNGCRYVVKCQRSKRGARLRACLSAALCGMLFGVFPSPGRLRTGGIQQEAQRLRALRAHGCAVPEVYQLTADHLLFEYCGPTVEALLGELRGAQRNDLLLAAVDDLAEFHRRGHWHGGAQLRNLTMKQGRLYRIDFEENTGVALPLPLAQAYDVLLAFNSMMDYLDGDRQFGARLLARYLHLAGSTQVVESLRRLEYWLRRIGRIERWLGTRLRRNRDLQRALMFASILDIALDGYDATAPDGISENER